MKHKIACAMIVGDTDQNSWRRCIESVEPYVDHLFVNYNGDKKEFTYYKPTKCDFTWKHFDWVDNFSISRNQSFQLVSDHEKEFDWVFWIDSDDELLHGEKIQEMLDSLDPDTDGVFLTYNYGLDPQTGKILVHQRRERFLRTRRRWVWTWHVHEVAHSDAGTQFAYRDHVAISHHRKDREDQSTRDRNRRILTKALSEDPGNARYKFYMASELFYEAFHKRGTKEGEDLFVAAQKLYQEFCEMTPFNDDVYIANHRIADANRFVHQHNAAIDADLQNIKLNPMWPESWLGIAQCWLEAGNWPIAKYLSDLVIEFVVPKLGERDTQQVVESQSEEYTPYLIRAIAKENLGELDGAIEDYKTAYKNSPNQDILEYIKRAEKRRSSGGGKETVKETRKRLYGTNPDKSIAFVVPPTVEPWHPNYVDRFGSGGAEHCVIEVANRFAIDGYRVAIFGSPGEYEGVDSESGIEWWNTNEYGAGEKFDTVVCSRWPMIFDADVNAKSKLLWMHDVNNGPYAEVSDNGNRFDRPDAVICLTDWHKQSLSKLYNFSQDNIEVIGNGVDTQRFSSANLERPLGPDMVYPSSPDRGAGTLLDYWPLIKKIRPDAEVHFYYGWDAINKMIAAGNQGLKVFKDHIERKLDAAGREDNGVFWHNRIPRDQLADRLMQTSFWAYPTQFCETFCITALENQLAGSIPLTSHLAALTETVATNDLLIYGWPNNDQYRADWLNKYSQLLECSHDKIISLRQHNKEFASQFTWDNMYEKWRKVVSERRS